MAEALNVKRHQLRRALKALRANGEIAPAEAKRKPLVGHNGEYLVRDTNPMEVIEMRIAIEPFLARLAALRASPAKWPPSRKRRRPPPAPTAARRI